MDTKTSQSAKILKLLKDKGTVTNAELNHVCFRYGARLHELRQDGYVIVTNRINNHGLYSFVYKGHKDDETKEWEHEK